MGILVQTKGLSKTYGKGENEVQALKECRLLLSLKKLTIPFPHHTCFHPFNNV